MFTPNVNSLPVRLGAPVVVLLAMWAGESLAQSFSATGLQNHEQSSAPPLEVFAFPNSQRVGAAPTMNLGVRYRVSEQHVVFANASGVRGANSLRDFSTDPLAPGGETKLGVEWKPAKSALGLERGAIGLQLDSGYRLSLRTRRGGAAIYLRGKF